MCRYDAEQSYDQAWSAKTIRSFLRSSTKGLVTKEQKEQLFNTFYRVDDSRHRETVEYVLFRMIFKAES